MATVPRHDTKVGWSVKKQSAFGTPLVKADLTRHVKLPDPVIIKPMPDFWSDREMIGKGHDFESQRGINRQRVEGEIPMGPVPVDFLAYLLALLFGDTTDAVVQAGTVYSHTSILDTLANVPQAVVATLAVYEDGVDQIIQDLALRSITIRGDGTNRMEAGCSFIGAKLGTPLDTYTWPTAAALRYLNNFSGVFTLDGADLAGQIRSFELSVNVGIDEELAWQKVAAEANRIYPSWWPYTEQRSASLKVSILAESGDIATYRAAYLAGTEIAVILSCLGSLISGSSPADYDELQVSLPAAVITEFDYNFAAKGLMQIEMTLEGHWDTGGIESVIQTMVIEGEIADLFPA